MIPKLKKMNGFKVIERTRTYHCQTSKRNKLKTRSLILETVYVMPLGSILLRMLTIFAMA